MFSHLISSRHSNHIVIINAGVFLRYYRCSYFGAMGKAPIVVSSNFLPLVGPLIQIGQFRQQHSSLDGIEPEVTAYELVLIGSGLISVIPH